MADRTCPECGRTVTRNGNPLHLTRGVCQGCYMRHWHNGTLNELAPVSEPRAPMSITPSEKACAACRVVKEIGEFNVDRSRPDGRQCSCRDCRSTKWKAKYAADPARYRDQQLQVNYGITAEQFDKMVADQGGVCAICTRAFPDDRAPAVDHDHSCCPGKKSCGRCLRKLLCGSCNRGIGLFSDDPARLLAAAAYLRGDNT
jgi:hypothetical protein